MLPIIGIGKDSKDRKDHVDKSFWYKSDFIIIIRRCENVILYQQRLILTKETSEFYLLILKQDR
jgi:hypothetical protein